MSCNICHTPILVDRRYLNLNEPNMITQTDHLEPIVGHVCPPKVHQPYFRKVVQLDWKFEGIVANGLVHAGRGSFISSYWDIVGGMAFYYQQEEVDSSGFTKSCYHVAHEGCLKLYCGQIGVPFNLTPSGLETMLALLERHEFLGPTLYGGYEGIDYSAGKLDERWLSQPCGGEDANIFEWDFENGQEDWTMKRPDLFPRLHKEVKPERLELCNNPTTSEDSITSAPDLVFLAISSHLSLPDLYNLSMLNKELRRRCLTTTSFQLLVRDRLSLTWAVPMTSEYPSSIPDGFPHDKAKGDWLLYGYHVFKTHSMRNRRRIFNIISQLQSQYEITATAVGYLHGPHSEQMQLNFRAMVEEQLLLQKVSQMYDYELFLKVLDMFNDAWAKDLKKPKFKGGEVQMAVIETRRLVEGKKALPRRNPGEVILQRMEKSLRKNQGVVMAAKQVGSRGRRLVKDRTTTELEGTIVSNPS